MSGAARAGTLPAARPRGARAAMIVLIVAACTLSAASAAAQTLQGRVLDAATGAPIAAAVVQLLDGEGRAHGNATTDADGGFSIAADAPGEYRIGVEALGYAAASLGPVTLTAGAPTSVLIRMAADAVPLDALHVEAAARVAALERAGFYDRRRLGHGRFFDRAEIEQRNARRVGDILRTLAGVRVIESGNVADLVLRAGGVIGMRGGASTCSPEIYLDGRLVSRGGDPGGGGRFNLNEIRPTELEAIEVYASAAQVPPRFGGAHAACGVVLFWSRQ